QFRNLGIDQHDRAESESQRTACSEYSVGCEFSLQNKETQPEDDERRAQPVDRQHGKRGQAQQGENGSGDARRNQSRRGKLHVESERPEYYQHQSNIGIGNRQQQSLAQRRLVDIDGSAGEMQSLTLTVEACNLPSLKLPDE